MQMPWILIWKYSSLYLTSPPRRVSHAWLDCEAISRWITTQPASFCGKSFTHFVEASNPKDFPLFFPAVYNMTYCTFTCTTSECQLIILSFSAAHDVVEESDWAQNAVQEPDRAAPLSKSQAVQYPIGSHVQVWCWQDISAGQCICSCPSSETLSAPTLHYHNALGSVKRPAVIWKGNYLLWNLLRQK